MFIKNKIVGDTKTYTFDYKLKTMPKQHDVSSMPYAVCIITDISKKINEKMKQKTKKQKTITDLDSSSDDDGYISIHPTQASDDNMNISMSSLDDIQMKKIGSLKDVLNNFDFNDDSGFEKSYIRASTPKTFSHQDKAIPMDSDENVVPMEWSDDEKNKTNDVSFTDLCSTSSDSDNVEITNILSPNIDNALITQKTSYWHTSHEKAIERLYPQINMSKDIIFEQLAVTQKNGIACGVYACANVVSLALGYDPTKMRYKINEQRNEDEAKFLRLHLAQIIRSGQISLFPVISCNEQLKLSSAVQIQSMTYQMKGFKNVAKINNSENKNTCYANSLLQIILNQSHLTDICLQTFLTPNLQPHEDALLQLIHSYKNSH